MPLLVPGVRKRDKQSIPDSDSKRQSVFIIISAEVREMEAFNNNKIFEDLVLSSTNIYGHKYFGRI